MALLKNFKRLIAAKNVLRLVATKLRLNKLQKSKTTSRKIKKHPTTTITNRGSSSWLSLSFQSRIKHKRKEIQRYPRKKTKPVYVDQLFLDKNVHVDPNYPVVERIIRDKTVALASDKSSDGGADEMWESLVMGSAQMDGINERAEEFISRFRADLLFQEITARRL